MEVFFELRCLNVTLRKLASDSWSLSDSPLFMQVYLVNYLINQNCGNTRPVSMLRTIKIFLAYIGNGT
eukprot:15334403-Ditylum_brightwellii.AAC.1